MGRRPFHENGNGLSLRKRQGACFTERKEKKCEKKGSGKKKGKPLHFHHLTELLKMRLSERNRSRGTVTSTRYIPSFIPE